MIFIYHLSISFYYLMIRIAAIFNRKARLWVKGRRNWKAGLEEKLGSNKRPVVWMHCSSLGEFEQGRPVIESIKAKRPDCFILVSFFSPSGYEVRKQYAGADYVCYLPRDYRHNAEEWMRIVNPSVAVFVKYEFWYEILTALHRRNIPVLLISANFRKDQLFFKWYGQWYRKMLKQFSLLFVQHKSSADLLSGIGMENVRIAGDTRFDRVLAIPLQAKDIPLVSLFSGNKSIVIAGSTWDPDEQILSRYINQHSREVKYILVPHEISASHLHQLEARLERNCIRFSRAQQEQDVSAYQVLIIDNVGMLSSLYKYASIAYIGGGFGKGIHNTLEAATFGMPVIFGPNFEKFREAVEMVQRTCAFPIRDYQSLESVLDMLLQDETRRKDAGNTAASFVKESTGATALIVESVMNYLPRL